MTDQSARDALLALEQRRIDAIGAADAAALTELLTDDYQHVHANGLVQELGDYVPAITAEKRTFRRGELAVRVYGDAAVLTGEQINIFPDRESIVVVTQVAARAGDIWRFASTHVSRIS